MNSDADNNCSVSHSPRVSSRSVEIMENHICIIDEEIASLASRLVDNNAEITAWLEDMSTRLNKFIELKRELNNTRIQVEEFQKTCDNVLKHGSDLSEMLKSNLVKYRGDVENKWEIYQAQVENLPFAAMCTEAENRYSRHKVEMLVMRYELTELEEAIAKKKEIHIMRRNSFVLEYDELSSESESEEEEEIMEEIAELTEKESHESATGSAEKSNEKEFPPFTQSQRLPLQELQPELGETERKKPRII